jgi:predicted anti-sigma-YlaC factor YlaD
MRCNHAHTLASRRLDGRLADAEKRGLELHLSSCAGCRAFAASLESAWRRLDEAAPALPPTPDLFGSIVERVERRRTLATWLAGLVPSLPRFAASAAVLVAVAAGGVALGSAASRPLGRAAPAPFEAALLADAFADVPVGSPLASVDRAFTGARSGR